MQSNHPTRLLYDFLAALWKYRWRAAVLFLLPIAATIVGLLVIPKQYSSEAKLFVRLGRENAGLDPILSTGDAVAMAATRDVEMNSISEHLSSRALMELVLDRVDPQADELSVTDRDKAVSRLQKRFSIESPSNSAVIVLHCVAESPADAQELLATFIDVFRGEHMRVSRSETAHRFFTDESAELKNQLAKTRATLRDAKTKAGITSIAGQQVSLQEQIGRTEARTAEVIALLNASQAKQESLKAELASVPESLLTRFVEGLPNDGLATMRQRLFELRAEQATAASTYTEEHPTMIAIRERMKEIEASLKNLTPERNAVLRAVLASESVKLAALNAERETLQKQHAELTTRLRQLNATELQMKSLADEEVQLETQYRASLDRSEKARLDNALHASGITNISTVQAASYAPNAIRPQKSAALMLAVIVGAIASCGGVVLSNLWSPQPGPVAEARPTRSNGHHAPQREPSKVVHKAHAATEDSILVKEPVL